MRRDNARVILPTVLRGVDHRVMVGSDDLEDYQNEELIQNAFPYLTPDERELIISRICGKCFDKMFGEDLE